MMNLKGTDKQVKWASDIAKEFKLEETLEVITLENIKKFTEENEGLLKEERAINTIEVINTAIENLTCDYLIKNRNESDSITFLKELVKSTESKNTRRIMDIIGKMINAINNGEFEVVAKENETEKLIEATLERKTFNESIISGMVSEKFNLSDIKLEDINIEKYHYEVDFYDKSIVRIAKMFE